MILGSMTKEGDVSNLITQFFQTLTSLNRLPDFNALTVIPNHIRWEGMCQFVVPFDLAINSCFF